MADTATLLENVISKNLLEANKCFKEMLDEILVRKLTEMKKAVAARIDEEQLDEEFMTEFSGERKPGRGTHIESLDETRMPPGVIKAKERLAAMSDEEFAEKHKDKTEKELRDMAARHGYGYNKKTGEGSDHYLKRKNSGRQSAVDKSFSILKKSGWHELREEPLNEARIKIIKVRIRKGKIQRRKKVSNVAGFTLRNGKLKRMTPAERRRRRMGQRRGKLKRRAKLNRSLAKRRRSLMRRKAMGL